MQVRPYSLTLACYKDRRICLLVIERCPDFAHPVRRRWSNILAHERESVFSLRWAKSLIPFIHQLFSMFSHFFISIRVFRVSNFAVLLALNNQQSTVSKDFSMEDPPIVNSQSTFIYATGIKMSAFRCFQILVKTWQRKSLLRMAVKKKKTAHRKIPR